MRQLILLLSLAGSMNAASYSVTLFASCETPEDGVVIAIPTPGQLHSCTLDKAWDDLPGYTVRATALYDIDESDQPTWFGSVAAAGDATDEPGTYVARAHAVLRLFLVTDGPSRRGTLKIDSHPCQDFECGDGDIESPQNFMLGEPFEVKLSAEVTVQGYRPYYETVDIVSILAYEADGITPVAVHWAEEVATPTPEPSTYAFGAIGLLGIALRSRVVQRVERNERSAF